MTFALALVKFVCACPWAWGRSGRFFAPPLRPSASRLACSSSRRRCSSSASARPRLPDALSPPGLRQSFLTPLQFVGQFVATTTSERSVLLGVELLGLLEQLLDLSFSPLDFLVHVAVTHRLVPRGVRSHLRPSVDRFPVLPFLSARPVKWASVLGHLADVLDRVADRLRRPIQVQDQSVPQTLRSTSVHRYPW